MGSVAIFCAYGKISFYCKVLHVSRQAFNKFLKAKDTPWKYQALADAMLDICSEDECNDTYGRIRMYQALQLKQPEGVHIPGERTVRPDTYDLSISVIAFIFAAILSIVVSM